MLVLDGSVSKKRRLTSGSDYTIGGELASGTEVGIGVDSGTTGRN